MRGNIKEDLLRNYTYKIKTFESNITSIQKKDSEHEGYIINLDYYNDLKNKIQYEKYKNKISISRFDIFDIKDNEKIMTIKDLEFKTYKYLTNMILNGNKYIIIDSTFWKVICEKGKKNSVAINYYISDHMSSLNVNLGYYTLEFDNRKNNILEESNLRYKSGNDFILIMRAYKNLKSYYDFEIKIKKAEKISGRGYLVEKYWIDNWKHQIKYENIKNDYLIKNKSDKEIRDKLIYILEGNEYKLIDLKEIKNKKLNNKQNIEKYLKNNSLVLVSADFIDSFDPNHSLNVINYNLCKNTIEIDLGPGNSLKFQITNNIIPQSFTGAENNYIKNNIEDFKQNSKQKEIFNSQNNNNINNININKPNINIEISKKNEIPKLKSENNEKYINQIEELKKQLLEEKERNSELQLQKRKLEKIISSLKQENIDFKTKYDKEINKLKENKKQLENELNNKNNVIQNYISEINDLKENKNQITNIKPGEKAFSVLFMTQGSDDIYNYSMICKNTELFVRLEERLYDDFPQFKKKETIFMVDARRILRFQTLDENKIKRNNIISLFVVDSD